MGNAIFIIGLGVWTPLYPECLWKKAGLNYRKCFSSSTVLMLENVSIITTTATLSLWLCIMNMLKQSDQRRLSDDRDIASRLICNSL